jgi:integrase
MIHKRAGVPNPAATGEVQAVMEGISRTKGIAPAQKRPLTIEILRKVLQCVPLDLRGTRDRALLLVQFSGALRRSELVDLSVVDLEFTPDGLKLRVRKSKTDQEGRGEVIGIVRGDHADTCPIRALKAWLGMADVQNGPIFRPISRHGHIGTKAMTGGSVARIIKGYVDEAGLDPAVYSGHSARAGFITSAALAGASDRQISRVSRHRSMESLRGYVRTATVFQDSAAAMVGL